MHRETQDIQPNSKQNQGIIGMNCTTRKISATVHTKDERKLKRKSSGGDSEWA